MASVNRVYLIGVVATPPAERDGASRFVVGVPEEGQGHTWLERVEVAVRGRLADAAHELRTAQAVFVEGRLVHSPAGAVVEATGLIALGDPPAEPEIPAPVVGTHAAPRAHDRAGHPRRIHIGTQRERVVWVRPTKVGRPESPTG